MNANKLSISILIFFVFSFTGYSQAGMTTSPPKLYFVAKKGEVKVQRIVVSNPIDIDMQVGVSTGDWDYSETGGNQFWESDSVRNSCSSWYRILPESYFILKPGESRNIDIELHVPDSASESIPVRTSMVYFTQLNPGTSRNQQGVGLRISVRMGVKIYHAFSESEPQVEIINFENKTKENGNELHLVVENTGNIWADGQVETDVVNTGTGEKIRLERSQFYSLPGDKRLIVIDAGKVKNKGEYLATAVVRCQNADDKIKVAELNFSLK
jgi:hypothetical protein